MGGGFGTRMVWIVVWVRGAAPSANPKRKHGGAITENTIRTIVLVDIFAETAVRKWIKEVEHE
jgi:hypothetical protein